MYQPKLNIEETEKGIIETKTFFLKKFEESMQLIRVSAPKFLKMNTGLQDDLAGTCKSVEFFVPDCNYKVEIVHSLAKWKRNALKKYGIPISHGIWTDMDAIRKDEILDDLHSIYVDQYDWEKNISYDDRKLDFLKDVVENIFSDICITEDYLISIFPKLHKKLPKKITFIHSEKLLELYPTLSSKERENEITKTFGAVFIIGIGYKLKNGETHDLRAVDYDDWSTETICGYHGLNGDILVWDGKRAIELSSMGIRVDEKSLQIQSKIMNVKIDTKYHKEILESKLPYSIGGGIGQSRLAMFLLEKEHIGEVQVSEWSDKILEDCKQRGITLL
jgi:aspartate--ammonia ligase